MPIDEDLQDLPEDDVDLKRTAVLVVEDEEVICDVICAFLQKIGVRRVVAVRNAEDAIFQLEDDGETRIDVVLVDLMLPGASGLSLIKTIREHTRERLKDIPIVVVTSYTSMKVYKKAAEFDINGFLRKPIAPGSLEIAIIKALGGKVSAKALANYRSGAAPDEDDAKKPPGFWASLFGSSAKPGASASSGPSPAQKKTAAPPQKINKNV